MKTKITLYGMDFYAFHGCYDEEKIIGTRFRVDAVLVCNILDACKTDDITKTVNYVEVHKVIETVMNRPVNILETLCYRIISTIKETFPLVEGVEITVKKLNPNIGGKTEWVSVSISDRL